MTIFILIIISSFVHFIIKWKSRDTFGITSIIPGGLSLTGLDVYADNIALFLLCLVFLLINLVLLFTPNKR